MLTQEFKIHSRTPHNDIHDRRVVSDRRVSSGRRNMVRFDKTGGDRRSGYARRATDTGFIRQEDS